MKKIFASYELDELDIKDAIRCWLNEQRKTDPAEGLSPKDITYDITLDMKVVPKTVHAGMGDRLREASTSHVTAYAVDVLTFSAVAKCKE